MNCNLARQYTFPRHDAHSLLIRSLPLAVLKRRQPHIQSTRSIICDLASRLVATGRSGEYEQRFHAFFEHFMGELATQVELGQGAADLDYLTFQRSINANVKAGARTRHQILLRKLFAFDPSVADLFGPSSVAESGIEARIKQLGEQIVDAVGRVNSAYAAPMEAISSS